MPNEFPTYRVRLFLSVDLVGSTQLKNKSKSNKQWVKIFQTFYKEFPATLERRYRNILENEKCREIRLNDAEKEAYPKLWKTIGDEILFCCSLQSLIHLSACMIAFIEALIEYGNTLKNSKEMSGGLSTKGNAWVASFPTPNCSISLKDTSNESVVSEKLEEEVDKDPSKFDFLGKGIDAGFRISKFSSENNFTISPGLGVLVCKCIEGKNVTGFYHNITFIKQESLKGVVNNNPYPILVIDTCRDDDQKELFKIEKKFLKTPEEQDCSQLREYLEKYLNYHEIELPDLKLFSSDPNPEPPNFYNEYKIEWENEMKQENKKNKEWEHDMEQKKETENNDGDKVLKDEMEKIFKKNPNFYKEYKIEWENEMEQENKKNKELEHDMEQKKKQKIMTETKYWKMRWRKYLKKILKNQ